MRTGRRNVGVRDAADAVGWVAAWSRGIMSMCMLCVCECVYRVCVCVCVCVWRPRSGIVAPMHIGAVLAVFRWLAVARLVRPSNLVPPCRANCAPHKYWMTSRHKLQFSITCTRLPYHTRTFAGFSYRFPTYSFRFYTLWPAVLLLPQKSSVLTFVTIHYWLNVFHYAQRATKLGYNHIIQPVSVPPYMYTFIYIYLDHVIIIIS